MSVARDHGATPRIGRLRTSNYDISSTCNLRCEGCLYFSGAGAEELTEVGELSVWRDFFRSEADRGVNFAYVGGAEPSLAPDRIRACSDHIPMGVVFTNGTKRIDRDIDYRIHVSVWGSDERSKLYRGGTGNRRAMRNYAGDPRALFVMTLNALNIDEIDEVARACRDHGLLLTFSLFSPTTAYNQSIVERQAGADDYFRFSSPELDMRFTGTDLARVRRAVLDAAENFPETVRISRVYLDWLTGGDSLYELDQSGVATNCGNRLTKAHIHYNADMARNQGKCCSPHLDCKDCRAYAMSLATFFYRRRQMGEEWREVWNFWAEMFLPNPAPGSHLLST